MRRKIVAGNWKMNKSLPEAVELTEGIISGYGSAQNSSVTLILFPPFPYVHKLVELTNGQEIKIGVQNIHDKEKGAFTGEVAAGMIKSVGASHVLIGHSERRQYFNEGSDVLLAKMEMAYKNGLIPIYCCGESLEERERGAHFEVVKQQLSEVVYHLSPTQLEQLIIAYEPVWAIGTGKTATSDQAQEIHSYVRATIAEKFGDAIANQLPILYGGSCKPENAQELFAKEDIDGGLIGGASLVAEDFLQISNSFE